MTPDRSRSAARIAIIGPTHPYKGGIAQHTTELAHRLADRGHQVRIESWSRQYPARLYPGQQRVAVPEGTPFPATSYPLSWRRPDTWLRLGRQLRPTGTAAADGPGAERPDVDGRGVNGQGVNGQGVNGQGVDGRGVDLVVLVVVTPIQAPAYLAILAGLRGRRRRSPTVLALCHNVLPHERRSVDQPLISAVLRRSSAVLVHTQAQAELAGTLTDVPVRVAEMATHLWTPPAPESDPVLDSDPGLDPDPGLDSAVGIVVPAAAAAVPEPSRELLFFGLVRPYKGLDVLLRALAAGPADVRLTVAGEFWGGVEATRDLVAELGLGDRVDLRPGYVPARDVPGLFAAADALVLPYRAGTASQNVDLAHLHGLPVVATSVGTLATSVRDGVDGLLVPPDDPTALAAALRRLYEPGTLAALRAAVAPPDTDAAWDRYLDAVLAPSGADRAGKADCAP
ncbi:Glycosyl transferase 4-like domain-containing protein [Parafrankia irregularis]|uniref:Glycosyl transferase 4-like domain-containing protein n=1 Tax=Parafrankia irregularis TaxID=795642 RepID=A0A0S4QJ06_9ACTN|nr:MULTISPECIES: glycosyltransferase family 4 protein [Parafrankia]MBE3202883.1 glycosyltransferase family 4 protein [Parafrankia sp. CH37]CUU54490.1 Glycosyl transferase 4-like domain-containing protein [Parafrankia irregularis]